MSANTDQSHGDEVGGTFEPEYEDILGDCTILVKRVVVNKNSSPNVGERVTIRWKREIPEMDKTFPVEDLTFTLGDGDVEQALELITSLMKLGEKFTVVAGYKYMYGETGEGPDIPPKANFKFDIELVSNAGIVDYPNMDFDTRFNEAKKKKERGNILFRRRDYPQALNLYQTACKIVDRDLGFDFPHEAPERLQEVAEFRAVILCNTSVAQIKMQLNEAAVLSAREATKICPAYCKAYYRLGQAHEKSGQTAETISAYTKALQLHEGDGKLKLSKSEVNTLQSELERLAEKKQQAKDAEKEMYSRMFGNETPSKNGVKRKAAKSKGTGDAPCDKVKKTGSEHDTSADCTAPTPTPSDTDSALDFSSSNTSLEYTTPNTSPSGASAGRQTSEFNLDSEEDMAAMAAVLKQEIPSLLTKLSDQMTACIPGFQEDLQDFRRSLAEGMKEEEAVAMATTFLIQLGLDPDMQDPGQLRELSRQIASLIPENIRTHFEKYAETLTQEDDCQGNNNLALLLRKVSDVDKHGAHVEKEDKVSKEIADVKSHLKKIHTAPIDEGYDGGVVLACEETDKIGAGEATKVVAGQGVKADNQPVDKMINLWERKIQDHVFSPEVRNAREEILKKSDMHDEGEYDSCTLLDSDTEETLTDTSTLSDEDAALSMYEEEQNDDLIYNMESDTNVDGLIEATSAPARPASTDDVAAAAAAQSPVIDSTTSSAEYDLDILDGFQTEIYDHMIAAAADDDVEYFGSNIDHDDQVSSSTAAAAGLANLLTCPEGRPGLCHRADIVAELAEASRNVSHTEEVSSSTDAHSMDIKKSPLANIHSNQGYNSRSLDPINWPTSSQLQEQINNSLGAPIWPSDEKEDLDDDEEDCEDKEEDQDKARDYIRSKSGSKIATVMAEEVTSDEDQAVWPRRAGMMVVGLGVLGLAGLVVYRYSRK